MKYRICKVILVLSCGCLLISNSLFAQEIKLEKKLFSGWTYTTDGETYEKVGMSAEGLLSLMADNEDCIAQLEAYKSKQVLEMFTAIPGGFLIGWPLGGYLGSGGEWKDSYTVMLGVGIPLGIISAVLGNQSGNHLKKAVSIHNDSISSTDIGFDFNVGYNQSDKTLEVGFVISF